MLQHNILLTRNTGLELELEGGLIVLVSQVKDRRSACMEHTHRQAREGEGDLDGVEAQCIQDLHNGGEICRGCQRGATSWGGQCVKEGGVGLKAAPDNAAHLQHARHALSKVNLCLHSTCIICNRFMLVLTASHLC